MDRETHPFQIASKDHATCPSSRGVTGGRHLRKETPYLQEVKRQPQGPGGTRGL